MTDPNKPETLYELIRSRGLNFTEIAERMGELRADSFQGVSRSNVSRAVHGRQSFRRGWWCDLAQVVGLDMQDLYPFLRSVQLHGHGLNEVFLANPSDGNQ